MEIQQQIDRWRQRIETSLEHWLPAPALPPRRLHEAMRYCVMSGGKRIRPLLVYASGEALGAPAQALDAPATAIEFLHAFSLVHDDLPAMDDDDLRRGRPTTHRAFDEATAILAADALQPLAFQVIAEHPELPGDARLPIVGILAEACGWNGMTGGQAIDMAAEGEILEQAELEHMFRLKTGRLLRACVLSAAHCAGKTDAHTLEQLEIYADSLGLAYQIRDDLLDVEGTTAQIGKPAGSDAARHKATFPALFGVESARARCKELAARAHQALEELGPDTQTLDWLTAYTIRRDA
jgi:farnesyl diphosphate synthase